MSRDLSRVRAIVVLLAAVLAAAGCGRQRAVPAGPVVSVAHQPRTGPSSGPASSPSQSAAPSTTSSTAPEPSPSGTLTYQVWFTLGDHLFPVQRTQPATLAVGTVSLQALLGGPTDEETAAGVGTQVPPGVRLLGLSISDGVATVDLSGRFLSGGSAVSEWTRLGQVVLTIGQFTSVKRVTLELDGHPVKTFSIQGQALNRPWETRDFEQLLPAIVVERPEVGQQVSSPVTISGTADVFEATVSLRVLDENGKEISTGFTTATCGTGCRGTFSKELGFSVSHLQRGIVEAFEASAEDGHPINVVDIPVTLMP